MAHRKLTPDQASEVCRRFLAGESRDGLAAAFGVSEATIGRALRAGGAKATQRRPSGPPRPETRADFEGLGEPPADPVARQEWIHSALGVAAQQAMTDPALDADPAARRRELVSIARAMSTALPSALLAKVKRLIKADAEEVDAGHKGPGMEERPAAMPKALRGRPRRTS